VAINDSPIRRAHQALTMISGHKPGDRIKLTVVRDGKQLTLFAVAILRPKFTQRTDLG
jgi:S1-C subfamily serine protease